MSDSFQILYQGQLPNSVATLATVPGAKQWIVKTIEIVNNDTTSAHTFSLYHNGTTAAHIITPIAVSIPAGGAWQRYEVSMGFATGDTLAGVASSASLLTITTWGDQVG